MIKTQSPDGQIHPPGHGTMTDAQPAITAGSPEHLGARPDAAGVNFAVYSSTADQIDLCLFTADGATETARIPFAERTGDIWHMHVAGLGPGTLYGLRAHGRFDPDHGLRFNPNKLLLDPYARALQGKFGDPDLLCAYQPKTENDLTFDTRDSAPAMPRSVVTENTFDWQGDHPPRTPWDRTIVYEAHPRGLTMLNDAVPEGERGTYSGLACAPIIDHLATLGVTAVEVLPVHAFMDEPFLSKKGRPNYWGYNTAAFFAPEGRYLGPDSLDDFREMVRRFHAAGIEVLLDVVYNHSAEGSELGPTISLRGLDNTAYYILHADHPRFYVNDTGCGNTLAATHPATLRLILDSLRYWVEEMHVDGFRFDLATVLGRTQHDFEPAGTFFSALLQDPVLAGVKLIAEPWDIGPGGYRLGGYPVPFAEWNDRFRDTVRRFWRGDANTTQDLAARLMGSADIFDRAGRRAWSSVNFITSHDGFTLDDLVTYARKHNHANGEENRDGHNHNFSSNSGHEGPADDPDIISQRARRKRNLMATMMLSQGVPMLLAGDEMGNSQAGNNNAYCQDNALGWVDWEREGGAFHRFTAHVTALRLAHPVLRQSRFLHGATRLDGTKDVEWRGADGTSPGWSNPALVQFGLVLRGAGDAPDHATIEGTAFLVVNRGEATAFRLPDGVGWVRVLDTSVEDGQPTTPLETGPDAPIAPDSISLFIQSAEGARDR